MSVARLVTRFTEGKRDGAARAGRRQFLAWLARGTLAGAGAIVVGQVLRFLSYQPASENTTIIALGQPEDYPPGVHYVRAAQTYLGRDTEGWYALDAVCTHLGCLVEPAKDGLFSCPCHGSYFHGDGRVKTGPATKPLRHLYLWVDQDGLLTVDRTREVSSTVRLLL
jgi:Rieske Fe-S protein